MQTKLTLRLEEQLIERAKAHAKKRGKSVSQMVADYFALLGPGRPTGDTSTDHPFFIRHLGEHCGQ